MGCPGKSTARLIFESRVIVVLKFRPQRQAEPILDKRDFILQESAEHLCVAVRRIHRDVETVSLARVVLCPAIPKTPHDIVPGPERKAVLKIDIESIAVFAENPRVPMRSVIIPLQRPA